jgi:hypothetical protein
VNIFYGGAGEAQTQSGPVAYSLDCQPGTFTVTGTAATVVAGRVTSADPGSYTLTGFDTTLSRGRFLSADPGSFTLTGVNASTVFGRSIEASPGSFVVTGVLATLDYSAAPGVFIPRVVRY